MHSCFVALDLSCPGTSTAAFERQSKRDKTVDTQNIQDFDNLSMEHCHLTEHVIVSGQVSSFWTFLATDFNSYTRKSHHAFLDSAYLGEAASLQCTSAVYWPSIQFQQCRGTRQIQAGCSEVNSTVASCRLLGTHS